MIRTGFRLQLRKKIGFQNVQVLHYKRKNNKSKYSLRWELKQIKEINVQIMLNMTEKLYKAFECWFCFLGFTYFIRDSYWKSKQNPVWLKSCAEEIFNAHLSLRFSALGDVFNLFIIFKIVVGSVKKLVWFISSYLQ